MIRTLIIVAKKNFRDEELLFPKRLFESNNFDVTVCSEEIGTCVGVLGATVEATIELSQINPDDYDAVVLVGGSGSLTFMNNDFMGKILEKFNECEKIISAICIAPKILGHFGILKNRNFTIYNESETLNEEFKSFNGNYLKQNVVVDKNLITANGAWAAEEFSKTIIEILKDKKLVENLKNK